MSDKDSMSDESSEADSVESIDIVRIIDRDEEEERLTYLCINKDSTEEYYDRSDLMDGGKHQRMILDFERRNPPRWDETCPVCAGEDCEECECPDCERSCRFFRGVNYGCMKHPVI